MPVAVWVALIGVLGAIAAGVVPQVISRDRTRRVLDEIELLDQVVEHFGVESDQAKVLTESISSRVDSYSRPGCRGGASLTGSLCSALGRWLTCAGRGLSLGLCVSALQTPVRAWCSQGTAHESRALLPK